MSLYLNSLGIMSASLSLVDKEQQEVCFQPRLFVYLGFNVSFDRALENKAVHMAVNSLLEFCPFDILKFYNCFQNKD